MNNYDDIFIAPISEAIEAKAEKAPFDKVEWAAKKHAERDMVYELIDTTAIAVSEDNAKFKAYLDVQSHFDRYSAGNTLLILAQMPNATQLKDFDAWKDNGVNIKKLQKGIAILEPGAEYEREDGSIGVSYNVKKVFDITQTNAKAKLPMPSRDPRLLLRALFCNSPASIKTSEELPPNVGAFFMPETNEILVRKEMSPEDIFRSVAQELAHAELAGTAEDYTRSGFSFKAYCVSYMLCKKSNIDIGGYSFDKLPDSISGKPANEIRNELTSIREAASSILARMQKVLEPVRNRNEQER